MRPNLINRLKEEWNNLDPVDPLRGLLSDAIDALAEQPAPATELRGQEPLTDKQIRSIWSDGDCFEEVAFARAIEAAHGIKE